MSNLSSKPDSSNSGSQEALLPEDFFKKHVPAEISAAKLEFFCAMIPLDALTDVMIDAFPKEADSADAITKDANDREDIQSCTSAEELVRLMRRLIGLRTMAFFLKRLLAREEEITPILKEKLLRNKNDALTDNMVSFFIRCKKDPSDWIRETYPSIENLYVRSMLCLILGFRGNAGDAAFLKEQYFWFLKNAPDTDYQLEQGPLVGLFTLNGRFRRDGSAYQPPKLPYFDVEKPRAQKILPGGMLRRQR